MLTLFSRLLSRLSVGRKLLLIYLLDLSAVIFISGILINEKFIAIDFARKELAGNAYIAALREPLLAAADRGFVPDRPGATDLVANAVREAERRFGADLDSGALNDAFVASLTSAAAAVPDRDALASGRALVTRIGNISNLILDPDLDSYYTMSLVLLRYPELLEVSRDITAQMEAFVSSGRPMTPEMQTRYFIAEGRLDAVAKDLDRDFTEAFAGATDAVLRTTLEPARTRLMTDIDRLRNDARAMLSPGAGEREMQGLLASDQTLLEELDTAWRQSSNELQRLIDARIDGFFHRMWLHLGTALSLLCLILVAVFTVARHITLPLGRLAGVAETVARTGDDGERAVWNSSDEIGKLVKRFNEMLDQLHVVRSSEKELAARARAAVAQRELVEAVPMPMMVTAIPDHEVLHANEQARVWLDGRTHDPWAAGLDSTTRARFFQRLADEKVVDEYEVRWHGSATPQWAVLSARRLMFQGRDAVITTFTPINRIKLLERRLGLWAKVFEASSEGIMIVDADHRILSVNRALLRTTAHDMRDMIGESPDLLLDQNDRQSFEAHWPIAEARGAWQGEVLIKRRDESSFPAWMVISAVRDGAGPVTHYICASLDISERKANEERIRFLAHHDGLTALPNRALCIERLQCAIDDATKDGGKVAVLFIDLDQFKTINDTLGHHVGDGLLRSVSRRLADAVRAGDTVSRLGGDEFVVVLRDVADGDDAMHIVESRLVPSIRMPHRVGGTDLKVSCSVGVALFPDDATDIDGLMRRADVAMYQAKQTGRDASQRFTNDLDERARRKSQIQAQLHHALDDSQFTLAYQPKIRASDRSLVGVEALLRWSPAALGDVPPAEFIPIAEESRLMIPIGAWVIGEALRQHAQWKAEGHGEIPVSINVSAVQFRHGDLASTMREALSLHGVTPAAVEIELTESTLMDRLETTQGQLQALRAMGITVSVDDFGTGYSSLTYLNRFAVDRIKIDRSFIRNLLADAADRAITHAIIGLGHTLGLTVVAEGVESEEAATALCDAGCDELQGYHFARPLAVAAFAEWLAQTRHASNGRRLRLVGSNLPIG